MSAEPKNILDWKFATSILIRLAEAPRFFVSDIAKAANNNFTLTIERLEIMEEKGLVAISDRSPLRRSRTVEITEKGKRVAALLKEAQDIVESD